MSDSFLVQFRRFLFSHRTSKAAEATHACMEGGKFDLSGDATLEEFRDWVARALTHGHVLPPISEIHTTRFPLFVDVDLVTRFPTLPRAHAVELATVLVRRVALFYDSLCGECEDDGGGAGAVARDPLTAVVLARNGEARNDKDSADRFKHGLHVHWPHLVVDVASARDIRHGMLAGLMAHDWARTLDVLPAEWPQAIDEAPYGERGGLRVIGCSKKGCEHCYARNAVACTRCLSEVDMRCYALLACVDAHGEREDLARRLGANASLLVRYTSVRSTARSVTPGFAPYAGFTANVAAAGKGKRKQPSCDRAPAAPRTSSVQVVNRAFLAVARRHVVAHAEQYAQAVLQMVASGKKRYRVDLLYDGARYCVNKGAEHKSNRAYMVIEKRTNGRAVSYMRCYCKCAVVREGGGVPCPMYVSKVKTLNSEDDGTLFTRDGVVCDRVLSDVHCSVAAPEAPSSLQREDPDYVLKALAFRKANSERRRNA